MEIDGKAYNARGINQGKRGDRSKFRFTHALMFVSVMTPGAWIVARKYRMKTKLFLEQVYGHF